MPWQSLRAASKLIVKRQLDLQVEGAEFLPPTGPAIIAARHFHHLYDGCALLATVPRPLHIVVALDWMRNRASRIGMERACRTADWPVVFRRDAESGVDEGEANRALRRALTETLELLDDGRVVVIFPEGYPNIDPGYTPKQDESAFLPFQPGVVRIASLAARRGVGVPILPAGFAYRHGDRWQATLRYGEPLVVQRRGDEETVLRDIEQRVRCLSAPTQTEQGNRSPGDASGIGLNGHV